MRWIIGDGLAVIAAVCVGRLVFRGRLPPAGVNDGCLVESCGDRLERVAARLNKIINDREVVATVHGLASADAAGPGELQITGLLAERFAVIGANCQMQQGRNRRLQHHWRQHPRLRRVEAQIRVH